jgi:hypothetical protein
MHVGWQFFSLTLLIEVDGSKLIRCVALYSLASVWRRGEREKHVCTLARIASPGVAWRGEVW